MHPIYGCREKNWESQPTPSATFPEIVNGLLLWSIVSKCVQNLKFVALPVPAIIGGILKLWAVPGYAHAPFSPNFLMGFCSDVPCVSVYVPAKFEVRSFTHSCVNRGYLKILGSHWIRRSRSSKVVDFGTKRKRVCDFLFSRHSNQLLLSCTV